MVVNKRKKNTRTRGTRTGGWGLVHRGSGQKGGVGRAGGGKKADCKKPSFGPDEFGKRGFKSKGVIYPDVVISIRDIEDKIDNWQSQKLVEQKDGFIIVDLKKMGYTKLMSQGTLTHKLKIITRFASANTAEKLKEYGCELVVG